MAFILIKPLLRSLTSL